MARRIEMFGSDVMLFRWIRGALGFNDPDAISAVVDTLMAAVALLLTSVIGSFFR